MPRVLCVAVLLLASGCGKSSVDPAEIAWVFNRHSYAACDLARLEEGIRKSGPSILASFDHYALFFPPNWKPSLEYSGPERAGAGLALWKTGGEAAVVRVFPGSPAAAADIRAGDRLFSVNGQDVANLSDAALSEAVYGARDGVFRYKGVGRDGAALNGSLKREFGGMPTVWGFNIPGSQTGYLRIVAFSRKTSARIKAEMNDILDSGARRVIIDLRGNNGGSLDELAAALALFAPRGGPVFRAASRHAGYSRVFSAPEPGPYAGVKTIILADSGTLSRAEIFAAALREWGGAVVVGGLTAGNVSATRGFRLKNGAALRITVARLLTPSGADLDGRGVEPDVAAEAAYSAEGDAAREFPPALASSDSVLFKAIGVP